MRENSIFTITPPDMMLSVNGPSITIISENDTLIKEIEDLHESMFKTVSVNIYHCNGPVNEENLAWVISVMRLSDTVFVDLDTATELGIMTSIVTDSNAVYISKKNLKKGIVKLFNAMREGYTIYDSPEDYMEMVLARFGSM